ncbi:MAG: MFS transporter [Gammaproteobacteria bacterium]|nr:MFS transporter [Gammaproteobacteria bacterium]
MTPLERQAATSLAGIFAFRMLGLFMILPVFSLYGETLEGSTPLLIGLAIGIYGLTQALLQIPFGMLSDRFGRKPIIAIGLLIFAIGSVVAAMADSITGVIIGRALQGSGAIAAAVMALAADLTREEHRTKAMAVIGMTIGMSFAISMVLGPVINGIIGVEGIFWLTAALALGGIVLLKYRVPHPKECRFHRDAEAQPSEFKHVIADPQLLRLDYGIFILHMILTSSFVVIPLALRNYAGLETAQHWYIYLPVMLLAIGLMVPLVIMAEKKRMMKQIFVGAIAMIMLSELLLIFVYQSVWGIFAALLIFFIAFNVLEATLPSLISKTVRQDKKGTAMGVYSSSQFLGAFFGGVLGGWLYGSVGLAAVFALCAVAAASWVFFARGMVIPRYLTSYMVNVGEIDDERAQVLNGTFKAITGVAEAFVSTDDGIAYLKIDSNIVNWDALYEHSVDKNRVDQSATPAKKKVDTAIEQQNVGGEA